MKEVVLDTETTGLSIKEGHRIVEIGCIEIENLVPQKNLSLLFKSREERSLNRHLKFMVIQMNF